MVRKFLIVCSILQLALFSMYDKNMEKKKKVFYNEERPKYSFHSFLMRVITMQSLSGTAAYFPSDTFKPKNTEWKYKIPGMNNRHVKKVYSSFLIITEF